MLSAITDLLWIIYIILLIFFVLILLYSFIYPDSSITNYFKNEEINDYNQEFEGEDDIEDIENDESIVYDKFRQYKTKIKINEIDEINIDDETEDDDKFIYQDFLNIKDDPDFLADYRDSLQFTFREKLKIYNRHLREVNNDISIAQAKHVGNLYSAHDTTLERLKSKKKEFETIISILNHRLSTTKISQIKNNFSLMINNKKHGFKSIVGRDNLKDFIASKIHSFCRRPKIFFKNFQNIVITGKSGIGKTKIAEAMGYIFSKSGILARSKFRAIGAQDLTTKYVNDSAQITSEYFYSCLEGVLFIDEAYQLASKDIFGGNNTHNAEAVTELVRLTGEYVGLSICMLGGYKREMKEVLKANKGIPGRFPEYIHLKKYNSSQLTNILIKFLKGSVDDIYISQKDANTMYSVINQLYSQDKKIFNGQARDMQNLSAKVAESINGHKNRHWIDNDTKNNSFLILNGFKKFLRPKGITLSV